MVLEHLLREDFTYRTIVDAIVEVPEAADTRDTEAVKRLATGFTKLLFPHWQKPEDVDRYEFNTFCLKPAYTMREIVLYQIGRLDSEYRGKNMPQLTVRGVD